MPEYLRKCLCMPGYTSPNLKITSLWYISFKATPQCTVKSLINFALVTNFTTSLISPWFWKKIFMESGRGRLFGNSRPFYFQNYFLFWWENCYWTKNICFFFLFLWIAASEFFRALSAWSAPCKTTRYTDMFKS